MVKTPHFHCRGPGFDPRPQFPGWETEIPHATTWPKKKKKGQTPKAEYSMTPRILPSGKGKTQGWKTDQWLPKTGVGRGGDYKEDTQGNFQSDESGSV